LNASASIGDNLDPDSNVTEESDPHRRKQLSSKISTDEGITILINPVLLNACLSIRDNLDLNSNVSEVSDAHSRKTVSHPKLERMQESQFQSIQLNGMYTIQFVSNVNLIQMSVGKVIEIEKSSSFPSFQLMQE
jgi:hypothetical protein